MSRWDLIFNDMEEKKLQQQLERRCARMECCSGDIRRKALKALEGDAAAADRIVAALVAEGYVDDGRYAAAYAREKAALSGWGKVKIGYALAEKGIPRETVEAALGAIEPEAASARLEKTVREKYRVLKDDPACRLKLLKFVLSRGYGYDESDAAIRKVMHEND